jgi:predicted Zn-dependent protease
MTLPLAFTAAMILIFAAPSHAQLGGKLGGQLGQIRDKAKDVNKALQDLKFTEAEEQQLGADVSAKLRDKYGVVQDAAVHKYVTLVGSVVAANSARTDLKWTFVVLDTDGVNAFAAPGGFVHITRGALGLIRNEAELAGVLGHEIGHVTARHTIRAIQKAKVEGAMAKAATRTAFLEGVGNRLYAITLENSFDRGDEMESDKIGVALVNQAGYAPSGLPAFLTALAERNKALAERSGMFASHPEIKARLDGIAREIKNNRFTRTATVQARYSQSISYQPVAVTQLGQAGSAPAAAPGATAPKSGAGAFGVAGLSSLGNEKSGSNTIASAGSRGLNPDRDARGGPNKALVVVNVTAAEIASFKTGITG